MRPSPQRRLTGFTLVELMVAVAITGILAAIAYPAYTSFIMRSRRADAMAVLTAVAQAQERYRSNRSAYASSLDDLSRDVNVARVAPNYTVELVAIDGGFASGYEVKASVKASGAQKNDRDCATLSVRLENAELRYLAKDKDGKAKDSTCWPR